MEKRSVECEDLNELLEKAITIAITHITIQQSQAERNDEKEIKK